MITIEQIDNDNIVIGDKSTVKVKITGNITEVKFMNRPIRQTIQKIDKEHYILLDTGEIKDYTHTKSRAENTKNVKQSMRNLRDIINTNCTDLSKCKFITLTYKENMQDKEKLYTDTKKFHMRLRYYLKNIKFEYISVIEPQGRGAFHIHEILIFKNKAPFIDNKKIADIWKHGFTKTENIKNSVDNLGIYLTAYLCDVEISESNFDDILSAKYYKDVTVDENGKEIPKRILKGARLKYYPKGFRFYRCSRGIKKPTIFECSNEYAMKLMEHSELFYEKTIQIKDNDYLNIINYRQYRRLKIKE